MLLAGLASLLPAIANWAAVDFSAPAAPAARLLPELGKAMGVRLEAGSALAREVLLVDVKAAIPEELMRRIAQAAGGEWEEKDGVYRLTLNAAQNAKARKVEIVARGERLRTVNLTGDRPLQNALRRLSPETLGSLGFQERAVFSSHPTPTQRPMPAGLLDGIDLARAGGATVLFSVQPLPEEAGVAARIFSVDRSGAVVAEIDRTSDGRGSARMKTTDGRWVPFGTASPPVWNLPLPEALVAVPEAVRRRSSRLASGNGPSEMPLGPYGEETEPGLTYTAEELAAPPLPEADEDLMHPETTDPLALTLGEGLVCLARVEKTNLVAVLPDGALGPASALLSGGPLQAKSMLDDAWQRWGMEAAVADGWMVLRPREPVAARNARTDRAALGKLLRTLRTTRTLTLAQQADFAAAQPLGDANKSLEGPAIAAVDPGWGRRIARSSMTGERLLLRAYRALASLPEGDRPFSRLPTSAQESFSALCYESLTGPASRRIERLSDALRSGRIGIEEMRSRLAEREAPYERTVVWPNGVPSDAVFSLRRIKEEAYLGLAPSGMRPLLIPHGSTTVMSQGQTGKVWAASNSPRLERYRPGKQTTLEMVLRDERIGLKRRLVEVEPDLDAAPVAFDALPARLREQIEYTERTLQQGYERYSQRRSAAP